MLTFDIDVNIKVATVSTEFALSWLLDFYCQYP